MGRANEGEGFHWSVPMTVPAAAAPATAAAGIGDAEARGPSTVRERRRLVDTVPELVSISIATCFCAGGVVDFAVVPLMVACAPYSVAVPKLASGNTPELDDGASTIHSAEDRLAVAVLVVENDLDVVLSLICKVYGPEL